jgi:hypothetical protein
MATSVIMSWIIMISMSTGFYRVTGNYCFVIAVDPFPGEQVTLGGIAFSFVLPATPWVLCNGSIFYCNNILATKQIETPADCASSLMVRIGNAVNDPVAGSPQKEKNSCDSNLNRHGTHPV